MKRDVFLTGAGAIACVAWVPLRAAAADSVAARLAVIEASTGGRLGVAVARGSGDPYVVHRPDERFPMCSTFKFLAVSAVLSKVDRGTESLDRHVSYAAADLLAWAPVTRKHAADGFMKLGELCEAAIEYSDNTAANLILSTIGGPAGVTAFARTLGDASTRLDRTEPDLNSGDPGDPRDTTTPAAMLRNMQRILIGNGLSQESHARLQSWMEACKTGDGLLSAGIPPSWRIGQKTGLGGANNALGDSSTRNDIAIVWPPQGEPLVITAYLSGSQVAAAQREAAIANVARAVVGSLSAA